MKFSKALITLLAILLFAGAAGIAITYWSLSPRSAAADSELFTVSKGETARAIVNGLEGRGFIRSGTAAYAVVRLRGISLRAGTYRLSSSWGTLKILSLIASGKEETRRVTIPEGLSISKTARHLEAEGILSAEAFAAAARKPGVLAPYGIEEGTAEGYLFPDTYFFPYGISADDLVDMMVSTFFSRLKSIPGAPSEPAKIRSAVILASVVEREYQVPEEAPLIASVFANRLKIGMGLQSCATIEYIITEIQGKPHPYRLLDSDLTIPSDYNTYLWAGLIPGPICSPGLVSLKAAFAPADTDYLYFRLVDPEAGTHAFTRSLDEHVKAGRQLVLKRDASR